MLKIQMKVMKLKKFLMMNEICVEILKSKYVLCLLGSLEKVTLVMIILKLLNIVKLNWILILTPLWFTLIFSGLLGLYCFCVELYKILNNK
jgi:hypothetical protein